MPTPRTILRQVRDLPKHHQVLFWMSAFMLVWQTSYILRFCGDSVYRMLETPVSPPSQCEVMDAVGVDATGLRAGEVWFRVDMRCTPNKGADGVYVTSPVCNECGPEGWNTLSDEDGDGIYEGKIQFTDVLSDEPMVGTGILYRYGISTRLSGDSSEGSEGQRVSYPENLLAAQVLDGSATCAPASDGMTYAYRVLTLDGDGTEVRDVFGTCSSVPIPEDEWAALRDAAWKEANPFLAKKVDPWWKPVSMSLHGIEVFDPILFLTFCTLIYIYSIVVIGSGYVRRKERALTAALDEAKHKNTYLEHAAKILRHDMHSGINTYIPRGITSLERRLEQAQKTQTVRIFNDKGEVSPQTLVEALRLSAPLRMLKEGLAHTQKVYAGVTEFTNLVKQGAEIERHDHDLREILAAYLDTTSYKSDVVIGDLPVVSVNAPLFCTAIDNLIRNGLKYNDSASKMVALTMVDDNHLGILDNGRGMTHDEFIEYSKPYTRKSGQKENGTGLGLNICIAILHEHGFTVTASRRDSEGGGTLIKVKVR
jgi:signal transduction histidine kinase